MTPEFFNSTALTAALSMLPPALDTPEARGLVLAICLQESRLTYRRQINGPARSYAQFEVGGVRGVLTHPSSGPLIKGVLGRLDYGDADPVTCYQVIENNDVLCAAFARLLLYTVPGVLPKRNEAPVGWNQYLAGWRPGQPRRETWGACFSRAWTAIDAGGTA